MNKHCYRLIFSRTHGELRVVSELARSCSTEPGQHRGAGISGESRLWVTLRPEVWLLGLALFAGPVMANGIVADGRVAPGQRPEVIATQNGLPQVNITAANQAGVSHNQYQQFDVDQKGAILNNSAVMTSTRMAGMIQGNPNLNPNGAPARVILNEVNSSNPSQLRGFLEVAGGRAQVIVANPAGIVCNGCGTINAGRMTLTTGKPQMNADGSVAGYQVERGVVRVEGGGLNGDARHDTGYVDILARAVEINAGVWAKEEVSVVAGRNRISADGKTATPLSDDGSGKPEFAIDMGQMGGMYSGSIRMTGTEAGVGVRSQNAQLQAGKTLTVSSEGRLSWQADAQNATTQAGGDISLTAKGDIGYQGKLHSGGKLSVQSREGILTQSGTLAAAGDVDLRAARGIESSGNLLAGSNVNSQIVNEASLRVESQGDIRAGGNLLSKNAVSATGRRIDISNAKVAARQAALTAREGGVALRQSAVDSEQLIINTNGDIDARQAQVKTGRWQVDANNLFNQQAAWSQTGNDESRFTLAGRLDNSDGSIESRQLNVSALSLTNQRGRLLALGNAAQQWRFGGLLDNAGGEMGSNGDLRLDASSMNNQGGTVKTPAALAVYTSGALNNTGGKLLAGQALTLSAGGSVNNQSGTLSGGQIALTASQIDNTRGKVVAQNDASLTSQQGLMNSGGWLEAGNALSLRAGGGWDNRDGTAQGGRRVTAAARTLDNTGGRLQSGGDLTLNSAGDILNRKGKLTAQQALAVNTGTTSLFDNDGGSLQSGASLSLQGGRLSNRESGIVFSQNTLSLSLSGEWDNQGGRLTGNGSTRVRAASLLNGQGAVNALDSLDMQFTGRLDNSQGRIFSKLSQNLAAQDMVNTRGWMGSQGSWQAVSGGFDNADGSVQIQQNGLLAANWLSNAKGVLQAAADLVLRVAQGIDNSAGKVSAQGTLAVQGSTTGASAGAINNTAGQWLAGEALNIAALSLNNTQNGQLYSQKLMRLNLSGGLDNRSGKLQSGQDLSLDAQSLNNAGGTIASQQAITLRILDMLDNSSGAVRSNGKQQVSAANINNRQGVFSSRGGIDLSTPQLDNAGGTLISQGAGTYRITTLNNQQGKMHSGASLTLDATQVNNQGGQLVATQGLTLNAGVLDNSGQGTLSSQGTLDVQTDRLNNRDGGLILGTTRTGITARDIDNSSGRLQSAGTLSLSAVSRLDNRQGRILANGNLGINAGLSPTASPLVLLNQGGRLESAGALTLHTRSLENQNGTLLGLQALTLSAQQDYTRTAGETVSSNGTVTFSLSGVFNNLVDWLLPGSLVLDAAGISNPATIVGKTLQLTTGGALKNTGRIEADKMTLSADTVDNAAAVMGDDITVRARTIDNHGAPAVIAATQSLRLAAGERLSNRDGALLYSGERMSLSSGDLIENRASFIEADGDLTVEARRLDNLREGLEIQRNAQKSDYKWRRYNYYWRSFGSTVNADKSNMAPTTQQLTFRNDAAVQSNRYGTLLAIDAAGKRAQVRVKDNKGQLTELWVNYLALTPNADGTYAMTFYETRGFRQRNVPTPYQNTVWREFNRGRLEQWDPNRHIDINNAAYVTDYNNFRERTTTGTVTRDVLISEGRGARILAGGNMLLRITGQLLNDASVITANGNLTQDGGGRVDNRGYSINERRQEHYVDHYDKDTRHWYPTSDLDETTALATVDGIITGNGNVTINGASITNTTVNQAQISRLQAALNAVDAQRAELERNPLAFTVDGAGDQRGDTALASFPLGRALLPAELALTQMQHLGSVATSIPNNGLFAQHTAAGSRFLVVTDERFTRRDKFISSDYLLERVGYDPAQVHKRLGDGFYEQRLVREQVLKLTGRPSVKGEDAMAQYQQLMSNGARVAKDFQLMPGVALTPEQIAALKQDIVWLVSETVQTAAGPQTVWVPKVYLAQTTLRLTGDGALIGGGNLQLSANSITNAGNLFADKALTVDAGQFLHQGGDIRADSIDVQADTLSMSTNLQDALRQAVMSADDINLRGTDIQLMGAKLDATDSLRLSARNDLTITTARSSHTADLEFIAGSTGNRTGNGTERDSRRMAQVSGEWQRALGSTLTAGGNLSLSAGRDVALTGSQAQAGGRLGVQAGGDINIKADTTTNRSHLEAGSRNSSVSNSREEERLALSTLSGDNGVTLIAGNQLRAEGAQVDSKEGRIGVSAQEVTLTDARTRTQAQDSEKNHQGKKRSQREEETKRETSTGSTLSGQQGVTVIGREGDVTVTSSALHSEQGAIALQAKKDVLLNTASESESQYSEERSKKKGFLKKSSSHTVSDDRITREKGSLLSGDSVSVSAGNDLTVKGSAIAADRDVSLQAGHNVDISAATETETHYLLEEKKKSGLMGGGGIGFTVGKQSSKHEVDDKYTTQSQSVSTVGSSQGNVSITAGNQLHIGGADLVAGRDLSLTGDSVTIDPGYDQRTRTESFEQKQSGLTLALSGTVGSALNTAVSSAQQARKEGDGRLSALQYTKSALSGVQAAQAWDRDNALTEAANAKNAAAGLSADDKRAAQGATNTVGVTASWGSQSSKSETRTDSSQSQGSTLTAGQNLSITATGKNHTAQSGDIAISGSQLKAGKDLSLDAARDITLQSAQNTGSTVGKNSSKGGNIGVGIGAGSGGYGISVSAGVNAGKGYENGNSLTYNETTLDAGSHLSLSSGRDTTLKGAQASGEKVTVDVGRNLTLTSEQDSDNYDAKQQNVSAGGSFTFGSMTGSAYVSASQDKLKSNFDSVKEQTGLFAGKGGYEVTVKEHTQLDGAVIASTADKEKNRLDTGTLGWRDIDNQADYKAVHSGVSLSTGGPTGKDLLTNMASGMLSGANNSGHAEGTTRSGVSDGTLIVRNTDKQQQDVTTLNRDTEHANDGSISPIFNKEKEQNRLKQTQIIGEIGGQVIDIILTQGEIAALKAQTDPAALSQARAQLATEGLAVSDAAVIQRAYDNALQQYGTGSDLQKAAQAVTGALTALAGNNLAGALASGASPYLATEIKKLTTTDGQVNVAANAMAHAVLGAVTAQLNNQSAVAGGVGAGGGELAARYIMGYLYPDKTTAQLSESEKQRVSVLATLAAGLAGGVATGDTAGAVTGSQAGKNAVENNALSATDDKKRQDAKWSLPYLEGEKKQQAEKLISDLNAKDKAFDAKLNAACQGLSSAACQGMRQELAAMAKSYDDQLDGQYIGNMGSVYKEGKGQVDALMWQYASADAKAERDANVNRIAENWGVSKETAATLYDGMAAVHTTAAIGGAAYGMKGVKEPTTVKPAGNSSSFDPNEIRFSQNTVSYNKTERDPNKGGGMQYTYDDLVGSMEKNGWKGEPVDVIKMPDGKMTSMDNTRINAARDAGIKVEANVRSYNEKLTPSEIERFSDRKRGFVPQTWGEAITGRINKQSGGFSTKNPYGSNEPPRIIGKGRQ